MANPYLCVCIRQFDLSSSNRIQDVYDRSGTHLGNEVTVAAVVVPHRVYDSNQTDQWSTAQAIPLAYLPHHGHFFQVTHSK